MPLTEETDLHGVLEGRRPRGAGGATSPQRPSRFKRFAKAGLRVGAAVYTGGASEGAIAARKAYLKRQERRKAHQQELDRRRKEREQRQWQSPAERRFGGSEPYAEVGLSGALEYNEGLGKGKLFKKVGKGLKSVAKSKVFRAVALVGLGAVGALVVGPAALALAQKVAGVGGKFAPALSKIKKKRKQLGLPPISAETVAETVADVKAEAARTGVPMSDAQALATAEARLERSITPGSPLAAAESNRARNELEPAEVAAQELKSLPPAQQAAMSDAVAATAQIPVPTTPKAKMALAGMQIVPMAILAFLVAGALFAKGKRTRR